MNIETELNGNVKWFSNDKGYGFIHVPNRDDYYFHVSEVNGAELPGNGDSVSFKPGIGKNGKPAATEVIVTSKQSNSQKNEKPYYGKATYTSYIDDSPIYESKKRTKLRACIGGVIGALVGYFGFDGRGIIFGSLVGAAIFGMLGKHVKEGNLILTEITSKCLKCGGTGQVTARENGYVGFQCPQCKSFWKSRDKF